MSDRDRPRAIVTLPRWQKWLAYGAIGWISVSGLSWLLAHFALAEGGEFGAAEHPLAHWSLVAHGIGAYALVWLAGTLWPLHMRLAWRVGRNRASGVALAGLLLWLAGSGLWLYYGAVSGRDAISLAHWLVGLAVVPGFVVHLVLGRRGRSQPGS